MAKENKQAYNYAEMIASVKAQSDTSTRIKLNATPAVAYTVDGATIDERILTHSEYGESLAVNATLIGTNDPAHTDNIGSKVAFYLTGKRREAYEEKVNAGANLVVVHFVVGETVQLKSGRDYLPLEVVAEIKEGA
jgi:hypothetical protein